jgi:hypothetical protein
MKLWKYIRMIWRGRWVPGVIEGEDGWRARHTRTGLFTGDTSWTITEATRFCRWANFGEK